MHAPGFFTLLQSKMQGVIILHNSSQWLPHDIANISERNIMITSTSCMVIYAVHNYSYLHYQNSNMKKKV